MTINDEEEENNKLIRDTADKSKVHVTISPNPNPSPSPSAPSPNGSPCPQLQVAPVAGFCLHELIDILGGLEELVLTSKTALPTSLGIPGPSALYTPSCEAAISTYASSVRRG
ncbi:hypothetical protein TWF970_005727 [Orbilia oligospora]|uniref:Uncharacterized protein n=1 Tax=Orbilia oligospora TaxID=2813651 RepID=A0A7C8RJF8_ORBOL|nr:hypothetical protein TWF970_005727 [Orbilia oligospora]